MARAAEPGELRQGLRIVAATALGGAIAGVLILLLGNLVSIAGPSGDGWSFRGNGALIVPIGVGPAVLAGGWTALVLHARAHPRWLPLAIGAGLVELAIVAVSIVPLLIAGSAAGAAASGIAFVLQLLWVAASPLVAAFLPEDVRVPTRLASWHWISGLVLPLTLMIGFGMTGFFVRT